MQKMSFVRFLVTGLLTSVSTSESWCLSPPATLSAGSHPCPHALLAVTLVRLLYPTVCWPPPISACRSDSFCLSLAPEADCIVNGKIVCCTNRGYGDAVRAMAVAVERKAAPRGGLALLVALERWLSTIRSATSPLPIPTHVSTTTFDHSITNESASDSDARFDDGSVLDCGPSHEARRP